MPIKTHIALMYQAENDLRRYFENNPGRLLQKWLHYFEIYDHHFRRYRGKPLNILEIGVFHGGSIQLWKDYFGPQVNIYAVDIDPRCKQFEEEHVRVFIGDQGDRDFLRRLKQEIPRPDILIDDGGHLMHQQIATFEELYPFVAEDGVYVCEDLHTSYWTEWGGGLRRPGTFIEFSKRLIDSLNGFYSGAPERLDPNSVTRSAHSLHFYDSMLVVEKQQRDQLPEEKRSGKPVFEEGSIGSFPDPIFTFAVLTADAKGSSRVEERLFIPAQAENSRFKLVYGGWKEGSQTKYADKLIHEADGYLVHNQFPDMETADVLNHIFGSGKPVIHFFDESMPELASGELRVKAGFRLLLVESLQRAHLTVVEGEVQKSVYRGLTDRISALPPKLDVSRYPAVAPAADGVLRVIYRGYPGHLENLLLIGESLRKAADGHPGKIEFHFFGRGLAALGEHPAFHFYPFPATHAEWNEAIGRIQPALALMPLADKPENALAPTLPILEYAAYGIPVLASDTPAYRTLSNFDSVGQLLENRADVWLNALEGHIASLNGLADMSQKARRWLEDGHALLPGSTDMAAVFEQAANNARSKRFNKAPIDFEKLRKQQPYPKFLAEQRLKTQDVCWMAEEAAKWEGAPSFHLLVTLLPDQTKWLPYTLDSLIPQIYPHWKLTIVAFTPKPDDLVLDSRARWYEVGDDEDSYEALNRLAMEGNADWVGFVEAGDMLPQHAMFKFAFHARRSPGWQVMYADDDQISPEFLRSNPKFKPDYNPDLLHAYPYTGLFCLFDQKLYSRLGGIDGEFDGIEVYDLLLRCTEQIAPDAIGHLAEILYSRFELGGHSIRPLQEIRLSSEQALRNHMARRGIAAEIETDQGSGAHRVVYPLTRQPLVSILIPTRDHIELIKPCIETLLKNTDYPNYEILILNNDSRDEKVLAYFEELAKNPKIRIVDYPQPFNFSAMCNLGAHEARGEFLLLLNNDTEAIHPEWLSEMVRHGLRPEVGVVGARLLFPNNTVQHAGVVVGLDGIAGHPFSNDSIDSPGYMGRAQLVQNYSAVTGACMLVRKDLYLSLGGMDEIDLKILYNDIDFCLRVRERKLLVVWTPFASLIHKTSASIEEPQNAPSTSAQRAQSHDEHHTMCRRWLNWMAHDPAYNRNLTLELTDFGMEIDQALSWDPAWRPAPRVVAYPGDLTGCGEYRIFAPCRALSAAGLVQGHVSTKLYHPSQLAKIEPDVIVLQRQVEDNHLDAIGETRRYSRAFRVFEIDDLLHDLPLKSVHRGSMHGDELERLVEGISLCDRLITTSPALADAYGRHCKDVKIVPNYLERAKWGQLSPVRLQTRKPRVGWAGGASHTGDLLLLSRVIKELHQEVDWVFFGMCPMPLRPYIHEFHDPVKLDMYPAKLASLNLDLALVPLEYNRFNEAKSALKILECGVLGYPVICTDIVTYQGDFPVVRVSNNTDEWIEAIRDAISDRDELAVRGNVLREHIQNHWMLEDNLDKWLEGWLP